MVARARRRRESRPSRLRRSPARCLVEAERLFNDFRRLTPYKFRPFHKTFDSFEEYEQWRRAQTNPWYR